MMAGEREAAVRHLGMRIESECSPKVRIANQRSDRRHIGGNTCLLGKGVGDQKRFLSILEQFSNVFHARPARRDEGSARGGGLNKSDAEVLE